MNWTTGRPWLATLARLVLGGLFLWSGWAKLGDPRTFLRGVLAYDATPDWLAKAIAYGLPVLELCLAALLIFGVITRLAASVTGVLHFIFLVGILQAAARGIKLDCGCFGDGGVAVGSTSYLLDIARDVVLLALAVFLVRWPLSRISVDEFLAREDYVEMPSAKRMRTEQGRRKYQSEVAKRHRVSSSRHAYLLASLSIVVVLISVIGIGVQAKRVVISGVQTAANGTVTNGITVGKSAPVTVDVFEDFQCPACQTFQQSAGADIASLIAANRAQVRFHMVAILDASSNGNRYSSRAANASVCASDLSTTAFLKYHDFLYGKDGSGNQIQPAEGGNGRTDSSLITYAKDSLGIGLTDLTTFQTCVQGEEHKAFVQGITDNFIQRGYNGTPVVLVNGKKLSNLTRAGLDSAVAAATAAAPKAKATPSASPSAPASGAPRSVAAPSAVVTSP